MTFALHVFSKATRLAIRIACDTREPARARREAAYSAYANARAAARAAFAVCPALRPEGGRYDV